MGLWVIACSLKRGFVPGYPLGNSYIMDEKAVAQHQRLGGGGGGGRKDN